jgi:hypothetical protein
LGFSQRSSEIGCLASLATAIKISMSLGIKFQQIYLWLIDHLSNQTKSNLFLSVFLQAFLNQEFQVKKFVPHL